MFKQMDNGNSKGKQMDGGKCMMVIVIHVVFRVCACVIAMQRDFSWRERGILREKGLRGAFHKKGERGR